MGWNPNQIDSEILAVHAALVPNGPQGEVVLFGGDEHWGAQAESAGNDLWKKTRVYNVASHSLVAGQVQSPDSDVFCAHHAFIGDGRLLIAGGTSKWPEGGDGHAHTLDFLGHSRCWLYNPRAREWVETGRLNRNPDQPDEARSGGRWYPGVVPLGDGSAVAFFGHLDQDDFRHRNTLPERYFPSRAGWINLPGEIGNPGEPNTGGRRFLFFPRCYTLPSGKLFSVTPLPHSFAGLPGNSDGPHSSTAFDPDAGTYTTPRAASEDGVDGGWNWPAVLLPLLPRDGQYNARALYWNGATPRSIDIDAASPAWSNAGTRDAAVSARLRQYCNMVLLPTGQVCVAGGMHVVGSFDDPPVAEDPVNQVELFTPDINWATNAYASTGGSWSLEPGNAINNRNYHSTALLLPNGKVWVAGGSVRASSGDPATRGIRKIELYEPPYIAVANRLQILSAPLLLPYGEEFDVGLDRAATDVARAAVIRNGSVTHSTDNDQRYVGLEIVSRNGNSIRLKAPPRGEVAPPGYYMLWVVDTAGNPCRAAPFVRLGHLSCRVIANNSTYSEEQVAATGGGSLASFAKALLVDFDGYRDPELVGMPSATLTWADDGTAVPGFQMSLLFAGRYSEASPPHPDIPTRITYAFDVIFGTMGAFAGWLDRRDVIVRFSHNGHDCEARLKLSKSPNPYMIDVDSSGTNPYWLSTDVRVFKLRAGDTRFGGTMGLGGNAPQTYIRGLIDRLGNGSQSFTALPDKQADSVLDGAFLGGFPLMPTFNFAVARVRYRATATTAQQVRCFFRMMNVATTGLEFDTATVYRATPGANPVPLLGTAGGQLASIPFTNEARIATVTGQAGAAGLGAQPLNTAYDIRDIAPGSGGAEVSAYFGVYLDINVPTKRFPAAPAGDGPYPDATSLPIRDLLRGWHNCLVAEIRFGGDPTDPGSTPASSDNLSQRNLAIIGLENPGLAASRTVMHSFEVAPSAVGKDQPLFNPTRPDLHGGFERQRLHYPDELFFDWHNLPADAEATLYFSDIDTAEIERLLSSRISPPAFSVLDVHTIRFRIGDCAWLPLPGGRQERIPALIAVGLPGGIVEGQVYKATVHQVSGRTNEIIGSFTLEMPVTKAAFLLPEARRQLSFLGHILTTLDFGDRWRPLFERWVMHLGARLDALGGKSSDVRPNPDGSGEPYQPSNWKPGDAFPPGGFHSGDPCRDPCEDDRGQEACPSRPAWLIALVLGLALFLFGIAGPTLAFVAVAVAIVLSLVVALWLKRACPACALCALLRGALFGSALGVLLCGMMQVLAAAPVRPVAYLLAGVLGLGSAIAAYLGRCFSDRC